MKIEITLGQLRSSIANATTPAGQIIAMSPLNKLSSASLSAKMMHWAGRTAEDARKQFEGIEKQRIALLEKYRTPAKDEQGEIKPDEWELIGDNETQFFTEWNELLETTTEIDAQTFTVDELEKYSDKLEAVKFVGNDFKALDWMIVWPEEEKKTVTVESIAEHQAKKEAAA